MARASEDPPSPVDAYDAQLAAAPAGGPPTAPQYYGVPPTPPPTPARAGAGEFNELGVIALIASCIGFSIPGIVMGHIALSQIKRNGQTGHGFALAAVIVGYVVTVVVILAVIAFIVLMIFVISTANSVTDNFGDFG
jgi:hypothetical protein